MNNPINITQIKSEVASAIASQLNKTDHLIIESDYDWHHAQLDDLSDHMIQALIPSLLLTK